VSKTTSTLYRLARLSADMDAVRKGPQAVAKRQVRKVAYKTTARFLRAIFK
jgi:hypothetical protein